jgi:CheY-like chemotaxis protein
MKKRIMVIDDEPDIRLYLGAAVEDAGYESVAYEGGPILQEVEARRPDLIVLDIMMPGRSGMSMYRALRTSPEYGKIPVVVVTGMSSEKEFAADMFRRLVPDQSIPPPDAFLEKPVAVAAFERVIRALLEGEERPT